MIQAGALAHRVTVQVRTESSDGHDGYTESWANLYPRLPARVRPLEGRDLERARQVDARISHEVRLRYWQTYQSDLDGGRVRLVYHPTMVTTQDRTFEVIGPPVDRNEGHRLLTLMCKEAA